jgi:endoribonuclease Dicer
MTLVYKPEPGDVLIPRQYQQEIFLKAQQKNVIAVLDTGSGKTLISALLIKWIASQERSQKKVVIFLVPKVPLVEQQGNFIAQYTALRVAQVHSEVSAGVMDRTRWSNLFSQADVLVMTGERSSIWQTHFFSSSNSGQIFLNVLTHSHWNMNKVCIPCIRLLVIIFLTGIRFHLLSSMSATTHARIILTPPSWPYTELVPSPSDRKFLA